MARLRDMSIRAKLLILVGLGTFGLVLVLSLAGWMLATFRVNGPVYHRLSARRAAEGEVRPPTLAVTIPYRYLLEVNQTTEPAQVTRLLDDYLRAEKEYHQRKAYWMQELEEGPLKQALQQELLPSSEEFYRMANQEYLPLIRKGENAAAGKAF